MPIIYGFDSNAIKEICHMMLQEGDTGALPRIVLPFKKRDVSIDIPKESDSEILDLAMKLQSLQGLSGTRALIYVQNFVRANTYLNNREAIGLSDINLFELILPLHLGINSSDIETKIRELTLERSMIGKCITGRQIKNRFKEYSESTLSEILGNLRGDIPNRKISSGRGYDFEYFI